MKTYSCHCALYTAATLVATVAASSAALVTLTATGATAGDAGLTAAVGAFRTAISGGGANNGVAGGPFTTGRREVNWDAAGLDAFQTPGVMPNNFFNNNSKRGSVFQAGSGGSLIVSGRPASGSPDLRFNSLNASYSAAFQSFSADRLFGLSGTNTVDASFFVPNQTAVIGTIMGFGAIFEDVDLAGSRIDAFDSNNILLGSVNVPALDNGLSFAGLYFDNGERISSIRIIAGTGGLGPNDLPGSGTDMVAMDDFFYSEPQAVPEPASAAVSGLAALGLALRRRRA